jgi:hypothetical protein
MSYALVIADEAADDLAELIASLAPSARAVAIEALDFELNRLSSSPLPRAHDHYGRPAHEFTFKAGNSTYHWGATYKISEDERSLVITHIYKVVPLL